MFKIYIKRSKLKEITLNINNELQRTYLIFLLEKELKNIKDKLKNLKNKGLINNISRPGKNIAKDLVSSRTSILKVIKEINNYNIKG